MSDKKNLTIDVEGHQISLVATESENDFISLTDIAKYKNNDSPADVVKNWMRNRNTIEFLGLWERVNNPNSKLVEFDQFRNEPELKNNNDRDHFVEVNKLISINK